MFQVQQKYNFVSHHPVLAVGQPYTNNWDTNDLKGEDTCCTIFAGVDICNIGSGRRAKRG